MGYSIAYKASATKELASLDKVASSRVSKKIRELSGNPIPADCKKLQGNVGYRVRVGQYRIVYQLIPATSTVSIVRIAHRSEVYKNL